MLVETWLNKQSAKRVKIPGYTMYCSHRNNKKGGGVGILISQTLDCRVREDLSINIENFENLTLEIKTNHDSILLTSIYRPPNSKERPFLKTYKRLLNKFSENQLERLIIGLDHNMDLIKHEHHGPTNDFIGINLDHCLIPTITKPTRVTKNSATLIDNIIIGKRYQSEYDPCIIVDDISDHFPLLLKTSNTLTNIKQPKEVTTRSINQERCYEINQILSSQDWTMLLKDKNTDDAFNAFHNILQSTLDTVCPVHTMKLSKNKIRREPWLTNGLHKCIKKQKLLYHRQLNRHSTEMDRTKYLTYRNTLKQLLRRTKENYYKQKCIDFKQNTSKLWKMINRVISKENDKSNCIEYLKIENINHFDSKVIAEEFGKYFSSVGKNLAKNIPSSQIGVASYIQKIPVNPKSLFMNPTTPQEILKIIGNLANKSSSGHDNLTNILLKQLQSSICEPLTIIFNKSLESGEFPQEMKRADVIPLYKTKERFLVNNYRPISLLLTISKVLEKIVYKRTYSFLNDTNQLYQSQYGFRSGHSCESAICELVGTIAKNQEEGLHTIGLFIDLSKAFATLDHKILLQKLYKYGIRGICLDWFNSYLEKREMRSKCTVNDNLAYSNYYDMGYGTPQGSCLGPLLFLVFINDIHTSITFSSTILFADDTTLLHSHRNLRYLKWCIEEDLKNLMDWFKANQLTMNMDKTEFVLFSKNNSQSETIDLDLDGIVLKSTTNVKFLGLWIDNKLTWKKHLGVLLVKLKQNTNLLKLGNKFLTKRVKKHVYYAHLYSHIIYGLVLWGNMLDQTSLNKIQTCMNKCFTLITHKEATKSNFKEERFLTLAQLIKLENSKFGYKLYHNQLPTKLQSLVVTDSKKKDLTKRHKYQTRSKKTLNFPQATTKMYHTSYLFQSLKEYNDIKLSDRNAKNIHCFATQRKKSLLMAN